MPILKDHSLAGVAGALKNYYGAVHNPNKYHDNNCDPYLAEVSSLPVIESKNVLVIMDATRAQYNGGPGYRATYAISPQTLLISTDPVVVDAVAAQLLDDYRRNAGLESLAAAGRAPKWLATAEKMGLGVGSIENIDIVRIEVA